jgi:DNA-3-methyladenine glycosylase II
MIHSEKIEIMALPPYSFTLSCEIFAGGDKQIRKAENDRFWQVIQVNSKLVARALSDKALTDEDKKTAGEAVAALFSLDLDLKPFYENVKNDEVMEHLTSELWGLKNPATPTIFEAMVDAIVEQQISLKVANSIENKIIKKFGDALNLEDEDYFAYPTPQKLAPVSIEEFRQCGLSYRKAEYIKEASTLIAEGKLNLENLKTYGDSEQIIYELDKVKGVGVWTAEFTLLRVWGGWTRFRLTIWVCDVSFHVITVAER